MPKKHPRPIPELTQADKARFWNKVDRSGGGRACHLWLGGKHSRGLPYGKFTVKCTITLVAHRVAYYLVKGIDPGIREVCHNCPDGDNPACCNVNHLWLGTSAENTADRDKKGRTAKGDSNGTRKHPDKCKRGSDSNLSKLTEDQVAEIRRNYANGGVSYNDLAAPLGVSKHAIFHIVKRHNWKHV